MNADCMPSPDLFDRLEPGARKKWKREILRAALRCFNQQGVESATIESVREAAACSVGSIYHHFGSKEGIVSYLYFSALNDQSDLMQACLEETSSAEEGVKRLVCSYLDWVLQNPDLARLLYTVRRVVSTGEDADRLKAINLERYKALGAWLKYQVKHKRMAALPKEVYTSLLFGPLESYCRAWLGGRVAASPKEVKAALCESVWRSLRPLDGAQAGTPH